MIINELEPRPVYISLAAIIDNNLVCKIYRTKLFDNRTVPYDTKDISNADIINEAVDWFKSKYKITPQYSAPYFIRPTK